MSFVATAAESCDAKTSRALANQSDKGKQLQTDGSCNSLGNLILGCWLGFFHPLAPICFLSLLCLPSLALSFSPGYSISSFLQMLHPECKNIPEPNLLPGQLSHGAVGVKDGKVQWISMAFESVSTGHYLLTLSSVSSWYFWEFISALSALATSVCSHNLVLISICCRQIPALTSW